MKGLIIKNAYFKLDSVEYQINRIKQELEKHVVFEFFEKKPSQVSSPAFANEF